MSTLAEEVGTRGELKFSENITAGSLLSPIFLPLRVTITRTPQVAI